MPSTTRAITTPGFYATAFRAEVLPLLSEVAGRDLVPILARQAELLAGDADLLEALSTGIDPTDTRQLAAAPDPVGAPGRPAVVARRRRRSLTGSAIRRPPARWPGCWRSAGARSEPASWPANGESSAQRAVTRDWPVGSAGHDRACDRGRLERGRPASSWMPPSATSWSLRPNSSDGSGSSASRSLRTTGAAPPARRRAQGGVFFPLGPRPRHRPAG